MIKSTQSHYYYAYKTDDGLVLTLPTIPVSRDLDQLKKFYEMYKNEIKGSMRDKEHIIIKSTTSYEEIKEL
jgi:hypothetical protein